MYKVLVNELHYPISKVLSTHLHGCANDGDLPGVKILLELGAQINEPESTNRTPIFYAINQDFCGPSIREPNKFEVLKFLVKSGADINHQDKDGITPLMFSTKDFGTYGVIPKLYIARYLLSQNASTMLKDHQGKTFWDHILLNRNIAFIDFFIKDERTPEEVRRKFEMFAKNITPAQRKLWEREVDGLQDSYE
jgi:ankyrin repeat protein